jgi:uncharacterized protein
MIARRFFPILALALLAAPFVEASRSVPPPPKYYIYDEAGVVPEKVIQSLNSTLYQHSQATGEQVVVAVFNSLDSEELVDFTNRVFTIWGIGQKGSNKGALLAIYLKDRKIRIEVGYGLEATLTDAKSKRVIETILIPNLKDGNVPRAVSMGAYSILQALDSPLVLSGQADELANQVPKKTKRRKSSPAAFLILFGIIVFISVIQRLSERHLTSRGRIRTGWGGFNFPRNTGGWGGGGFGGGGFSGGGGRSGGGGASGSW